MTNEEIQALATAIAGKIAVYQKAVLNLEEASLYTGLSKSTLYKLTANRLIPYYKPATSRFCFFRREELEDWLLEQPVATQTDINTRAMEYCMRTKTN